MAKQGYNLSTISHRLRLTEYSPSTTSEKDHENSPPSVPEPSKRKTSRTKKSSHGKYIPHSMFLTRCSSSSIDLEQPAQSGSSSKRTKKSSSRKPGESPSKERQQSPKEAPKPSIISRGEGSTSDDGGPLQRSTSNEDDDYEDGLPKGLPESLRATLLGHSRSPADMSATLRSLHGYASGVSQRMRDLLGNLKQKEDPSVQLIGLQELSDFLLISNEDNLSGQFSPDQFVKELISLMQPDDFTEGNPEMMLLACRCLANMMEALPASTPIVVYGGAVPVLCQKLLEIDFIDLAEQALSTLEKISVEFPSAIVREGGLSACLNFLDFFATSTQRTAVTTAANCCKNIPQDSFTVINDVMPTLLSVLSNSDQKVVEQGSICVSRIVESFRYDNDKIEQLVSVDMLKAIKRLLHPGTTNLIGPNIHTQFLRVLSLAARASPKLSAELLRMDIVDTLYQILTGVSPPDVDGGSSQVDGVFIMQALIHRPREQITETLNVICEILPPVEASKLSFDENMTENAVSGIGILPYSGPEAESEGESPNRLELLQDCDAELRRFATVMFPTLTDAFSSTVNLGVRQKVLAAQLKMLSNLDVDIIEDSLRSVTYASFLASILSQQDHQSLVSAALCAADLLLNRLARVYGYQFYREGVVAEIGKLAKEIIDTPVPKPKALKPATFVPIEAETLSNEMSSSREELRQDLDDVEDDSSSEHVVEVMSAHSEEHDDDEDGDELEGENGDAIRPRTIHEDISPSPSESSSDQEYVARSMTSDHDINVLSARKFLEVHENSSSTSMKEKATEILNGIRSLAKRILNHYVHGKQADGLELFNDLSRHFRGDALSTITSSELLQSEIVDALLDVFNNLSDQIKTQARTDFLRAFMETVSGYAHASSSTPFSIFIHKLQDLLSRAEHFEVMTVHHNAFDNNRSSPYSMLSKQLKIKLVAEDPSDMPDSYHSMTLSIHAIATFKSLDEYLRPRIILAERPKSSRPRGDGIQGTLAALAAATGYPGAQARLSSRAVGSNDSRTGSSSTDKSTSSRPSRKSVKSQSNESPAEASAETPKPSTSRRSSRRNQATTPSPPDVSSPTPDRAQTPLECADQRQLSDDDEVPDETSALDAIVDDIDEAMDGEPGAEPSAVTMEVASTGKVTARQEDGTRIATPQSSAAGLPPPPRTPISRNRDLSSHISFATSRAMSYAAALQALPQNWHIEFTMDGRQATQDMTLYRAVTHDESQTPSVMGRSIWSAIHTVKFKRIKGPAPPESTLASEDSSLNLQDGPSSVLPSSLHEHPQTSKTLRLLNIFHEMNANLDDVVDETGKDVSVKAESLSQFVNTKLTAKLNRQLEEPLIVASNCLPKWSEDLARLYPFLFPFETRHLFLQSTSFGYSRSMTRWQNQTTEDPRRDRRRDDRPYSGKLQRQKVRIQRQRILESACKVMEIYGASSSILEIEYFDEVGTGLGPTLEFYSTVSKEFSKKRTSMWRTSDTDSKDEFVFGKDGLFPAPMTESSAETESGKKILYNFKMLGKFIARSMLDGRLTDISLNPIFFRIGDQPRMVPLSLGAVGKVDTQLAKSLKLLKQFSTARQAVKANRRLSASAKYKVIQKITINDVSIDDLSLDFTLPGYPEIELEPNGSNIPVSMDNVSTFIENVIDMTLGSGVQRQIDAFRTGFSEVFSYSALRAFTPSELVMLIGRVEEDWSLESKFINSRLRHWKRADVSSYSIV